MTVKENNPERREVKVKVKDGYILRQCAGKNIVVRISKEFTEGKGVFILNDIGAMLWKLLENDVTERDLLYAVKAEYEVEEEVAARDVAAFIKELSLFEALEE